MIAMAEDFYKRVASIPEWINTIQARYDVAASNVFKQHGIMGKFNLTEMLTEFTDSKDAKRFEELGGDEYFVSLIEEEFKKVQFVDRLKGSKV
jgi:hypothetical protein